VVVAAVAVGFVGAAFKGVGRRRGRPLLRWLLG